jgi:hypothetical protein
MKGFALHQIPRGIHAMQRIAPVLHVQTRSKTHAKPLIKYEKTIPE